ncbi:NUC153 and WD40 repeat-containing nucleolar rRNA processing-related protein [Mycena galericulata]|nr:NUC153 and WD40 repeat-containing nucleolar rRNA processing-related protein [Mycena galericulata]
MAVESNNVKVYTVNGATAASSSSLPDWLTRKRAAKGKGKRAVREHVEGTIELIQGFEFPEASNRIKTTRDGQFAIATGTYKPQMRVWDLAQLTLKFERHSDAENVDFVMLSDDWTKSIHLQNDRTIEVHTQGGFHYRTRIPRFGRSLAYHFPSCDALFSAAGNEVYRLNLDQGRFMNPLVLQDEQEILGVNTIDVNPAHQLLAFGLEGTGSAQFWDPRSRSCVGVLRLPRHRIAPPGGGDTALSVTAISSRADGLSYALGTSTGHTLLYDIRAGQPFALKDQGYGLPVKNVVWIEGGSRMAGDGMVLSADRKVIKIWDRNSPSTNFAAITPAADLNHVHHVPASGLLMSANEGIQMATYYIPQLGPAPRWASFLENITEEMEDQTTRSVYEDYKFVERSELKTLGLDHLVGTPTLKPYMHGYFLSLKLYDAARIIANPFAYTEYREKVVRERMEKMAETRIRAKKDGAAGVKVNKALAEKILRDEERERKRLEKRKKRASTKEGEAADDDVDVDMDEATEAAPKPSLLTDPRFAKVFEDPAFAVDENTREFALMNPSAAAQRRDGRGVRGKTAVEEEEEESDKVSSDGLGAGSDDSDSEGESGSGSDSSDAGALNKFDPRARPGQKNARVQEAYTRTREQNRRANQGNFVPMRPAATGANGTRLADPNATFGQRRGTTTSANAGRSQPFKGNDAAMEVSWVPSSSGAGTDADADASSRPAKSRPRKGIEVFGAGMEKGYGGEDVEVSEQDRKGRTQRRKGVRSGSKNVFRRMDT